jgi:ABC-type uncharacterized transport system ATPase subunit
LFQFLESDLKKNFNCAFRILNITKSFKTNDKKQLKAVDGINLNIYKDQITAILGHNGAGKRCFNLIL